MINSIEAFQLPTIVSLSLKKKEILECIIEIDVISRMIQSDFYGQKKLPVIEAIFQ